MKLRLIEGGAGSGKSRLCLTEIAERLREEPLGAPLILLTPEQATFQSERRLVGFPGVGASLRAQVLGFSGLYRFLAADEALPPLPWLDEQGTVLRQFADGQVGAQYIARCGAAWLKYKFRKMRGNK